jgi:hypothetical protein
MTAILWKVHVHTTVVIPVGPRAAGLASITGIHATSLSERFATLSAMEWNPVITARAKPPSYPATDAA